MGNDAKVHRSRLQNAALRRQFTVGLACFLFGVLLVLAINSGRADSSHYRRLLQGNVDDSQINSKFPSSSLQLAAEGSFASEGRISEDPRKADILRTLAKVLPENTLEKVLEAANSTDPLKQTVRVSKDVPPSIFMFVGVLSGRGYRHRRLAVREAWAANAQSDGQVLVRFILSEDEKTSQVQTEFETHRDMIFLPERTNYKSILFKTYFVMEYASVHYDARFVFKTDDDAFINIQPLIQQLKLLCRDEDCRNERIYMGKMAKNSEVLLQPGHKWNNIVFHNHTGLKQYPNYMMGGGYIVSGDVAQTLMHINRKLQLKFTPIEDATMGFWLAAMDLWQIDHPRFYTWAAPCCFRPPVRREGQKIVTRFQLQDDMENELCSDDPWLILHKIDSPTKMRYLGQRIAACNFTDDPVLKAPPSIAAYVKQKEDALALRIPQNSVEPNTINRS